MALVFYNTLSRQKEPFRPIHEGKVGIYACGPTVYNYPHIGNYRTFLFEDVLNRYLRYKGYDVTFVMNLTDVDDKTIRDSQKEGMKLTDLTQKYASIFFEELKRLGVRLADRYPYATEHIDDMLQLVSGLIEKGLAYESDGSIYFRVAALKDYGKLARLDRSKLRAGASERVTSDEYSKEHVSDFVLWKAHQESDGEVFWESDHPQIHQGRPGWHLECSAMSMKYLGVPFDIHCGAVDLIFPHHTNEIAQSEGYSGTSYVKYWLHAEHLNMGDKMSKSLGNVIYLRDLEAQGYAPSVIRMALLSAHYRSPLDFNTDVMDQAQRSYDNMQDFISRIQQLPDQKAGHPTIHETADTMVRAFERAMDDDLHIPRAWAAIHSAIGEYNKVWDSLNYDDGLYFLDKLEQLNSVLNVFKLEAELLDEDVDRLIQERQAARKDKDFQRADEIRDQLKAQGIILEDTKDGVRWRRG